ncbi:uncharacterized protein ACNLHF_002504 isoform 1-T1 [Anomaloglossus baeobatrachus]
MGSKGRSRVQIQDLDLREDQKSYLVPKLYFACIVTQQNQKWPTNILEEDSTPCTMGQVLLQLKVSSRMDFELLLIQDLREEQKSYLVPKLCCACIVIQQNQVLTLEFLIKKCQTNILEEGSTPCTMEQL